MTKIFKNALTSNLVSTTTGYSSLGSNTLSMKIRIKTR